MRESKAYGAWGISTQSDMLEQCFYLQLTPRSGRRVYSFPYRLPKVKVVPV